MFKLAIKDIKLFMADKRAMLLTLLLPIPLITLFSLAFGGIGSSGNSKALVLITSDEDKTPESKKLIVQLDSLKELDIKLTNTDTAKNWIRKGDEDAALILHKGFQDSIRNGKPLPLELIYDKAKQVQLGILMSALSGNLMRFAGTQQFESKAIAQFDAQNPTMDSASKAGVHKMIASNFNGKSGSGKGTEDAPLLKTTAIEAQKENTPGLIQAVAGTAVMMLLFSVAGLGASLLQEKEEGTLKKLLFAPLSPSSILFGKMLSANLISIVQLSIMFTFSWAVFGLNITAARLPGLILMIVATAFACSAFGVFLASFARNRAQVQGLSTLIVLTMSAIGGSMIPIFVMPFWMQKMAVASVNYWSIQGFYDIFWRALPFTDSHFLLRAGVLFGIGIILNLGAIQFYKKNILNIA
ncbi:MAG: ABC transporter permease [Bacteroidia bacterium]